LQNGGWPTIHESKICDTITERRVNEKTGEYDSAYMEMRCKMETGDSISELYKARQRSMAAPSMIRERIYWMCRQIEGEKVVDIGCSWGITSILLARMGFEVIGVDINEERIEYANSDRAKELPEVQQRLTFIGGNIHDVDLPIQAFDTAIMGEFLEHLVEPDKAVIRAYELLADGGKLVVTVPFGLLKAPSHKQTFYSASLRKLVYHYFAIDKERIIAGRYLCLVCTKRKAVLQRQMDSIAMASVEREEREFLRREIALTGKCDAKKAKSVAVNATISFQLGDMLVKAVIKPGKNTVLLPYRLARLGVSGFKRWRTMSGGAQAPEEQH
jgi:2-polyprenyl-3-methyl-5-hydroxy-6-metoxy-1,4-benzoquinol methylase